ncbi:MAG: hypothetical protein M1492_01660 [Gammaproteobacteria bacterium]|nr:hypothetical protein [Gammaproteobacteria bacterium]
MQDEPNHVKWGIIVATILGVVACLILLPSPSLSHASIRKSVARDTQGKVRVTGFAHRHGVSIVRLQIPKGPEIAYLVAGKYLAIGPLMNLKTGRNVTPPWEKIYAK